MKGVDRAELETSCRLHFKEGESKKASGINEKLSLLYDWVGGGENCRPKKDEIEVKEESQLPNYRKRPPRFQVKGAGRGRREKALKKSFIEK